MQRHVKAVYKDFWPLNLLISSLLVLCCGSQLN